MSRKGPDDFVRMRRTKTGYPYYVVAKAAQGKRVEKTFRFCPDHKNDEECSDMRAAAILWHAHREHDAAVGRLGIEKPVRSPDQPRTVGQAMDEFLEYLEARRAGGTVYYYRVNFAFWKELRDRPLESVTSDEIAEKLSEEIGLRRARRTVLIHRGVLSTLFNWARGKPRRYVAQNPLHEINMRELGLPRKRRRKPPRALRLHEMQLFLRNLRPKYRLLFRCLAFLGLRRAELYRMTWDWIDWVSGELHIPEEADEGGKTGGDVIPIPQTLLEELEAEREAGRPFTNELYLFSKTGKWRASHREQLARTCKRAGISAIGVGYHCLRHSMATLVYREGGNDGELAAKFLRHSAEGKETTWLYIHSDRELDLLPVLERVVAQVDGDLVAVPMRRRANG